MNTNNPDYIKHAKAALASKAEMDKWKTVEIIDAIAAVSLLVIAWLAESWMIAIVGIVICAGVGAFATSQKEKAKQDALDHMNRADGMSESLVGATRGRREAEGALAGAISQLDSASSKLRRASTYEEKTKAEAEVASAQAAIESAKLRLQQATAREASESQRSQQQAQSDVERGNQSSQESLGLNFSGEKVLTNDGYKIYLVKKHKIEKNDVLDKFVCSERLFESIDEALAFADSLENPVNEVISTPEMPEVPEIPEIIIAIQEIRDTQNNHIASTNDNNMGATAQASSNNKVEDDISLQQKPKKSSKLLYYIIVVAIIIAIVWWFLSKPPIQSVANKNLPSASKSLNQPSPTQQPKNETPARRETLRANDAAVNQQFDQMVEVGQEWFFSKNYSFTYKAPIIIKAITIPQMNDTSYPTPLEKAEMKEWIDYRQAGYRKIGSLIMQYEPLSNLTKETFALNKEFADKYASSIYDLANGKLTYGEFNTIHKNDGVLYNNARNALNTKYGIDAKAK